MNFLNFYAELRLLQRRGVECRNRFPSIKVLDFLRGQRSATLISDFLAAETEGRREREIALLPETNDALKQNDCASPDSASMLLNPTTVCNSKVRALPPKHIS